MTLASSLLTLMLLIEKGFRGLMAVASEAVFALASKRHLTMEVRDENGLFIELSAAIQSRLLR